MFALADLNFGEIGDDGSSAVGKPVRGAVRGKSRSVPPAEGEQRLRWLEIEEAELERVIGNPIPYEGYQ
jgi:hypothetical protein